MTTTMKLSTISPTYLLCRVELDEARSHFSRAEREPKRMFDRNAEHAAEVASAERTGNPLITNAIAQLRGNGSGCEVIYKACDCKGDVECLHDPRTPPYSDQAIEDAREAAAKAKKALTVAQKKLVATPAEWDAFGNARTVGARYCWWTTDKYVNPRLRRYRGQPLTDEDLTRLGPHELRRCVSIGAVIEVPQ